MNNFQKYYNKWREETIFSSIQHFDNKNFIKLCDPSIVSPVEMINESFKILKDNDDFVAYAVTENLSNFLGSPIVTCTGYVSIHDYCETVRIMLSSLLNENNLTEENLNNILNGR